MPRLICALAAVALWSLPAHAQDPASEPPVQVRSASIAILAAEDHEDLEELRAGLKDGMATAGYLEGENLDIVVETAGADAAGEVASRLIEAGPDVLVPVSTAPAKAAAVATQDIPIVFGAVADPLGAGLVESMMNPGGNATGVSDLVPLAEQLALIRQVVPQASRLGVVYDPDVTDSAAMLTGLTEFAPGAGFRITEVKVGDAAEVGEAAGVLDGEVDAIFFPPDEALVEGFDDLVEFSEGSGIPLFTSDTSLVARGALAAMGLSQYQIGEQMAALIARILQGEAPSQIAISQVEGSGLTINPGAAERMGIVLAPGLVARAAEVIE